MEFEKTDLTEILESVKESLKEELETTNGTINIGRLHTVSIVPFQFQQLLYNLISNSLKFKKDNVNPIIDIRSEIVNGSSKTGKNVIREKEYCCITISDNGIGFNQQHSNRIFEVFQRLHSKNEFSGTGIGLAIVHKIVDNHKGIISAFGEIGKGASFEICIPLVHD